MSVSKLHYWKKVIGESNKCCSIKNGTTHNAFVLLGAGYKNTSAFLSIVGYNLMFCKTGQCHIQSVWMALSV